MKNNNQTKFILITSYNPEQYIVINKYTNEFLAYIKAQYGELNVYMYNDKYEIDYKHSLYWKKFNDEYIGCIPYHDKEKIFNEIEEILINKK